MRKLMAGLIFCGIPLPGMGMIFLNAQDPAQNKQTAPTGPYANSGWQYQLRYKNYLGTIISPKHFITATHLGRKGETTQPKFFNGEHDLSFTLKDEGQGIIIDETTDLRVLEIWETFEHYAPLYPSPNESGKETVITGRGLGRGEELQDENGEILGWKWGPGNTTSDRWGTNTVTSHYINSRGSDLIYITFASAPTPHEIQLTGNDSGGGWFIKDGPDWKLAGITFSVDANHDTNNTTGDQSHFRAAIKNARGFYYGSDTSGWNLIPTNPALYLTPSTYQNNLSDLRFYEKTHSYATRISSYLPEINAIIQPSITHAALDAEGKFQRWLSDAGITAATALDDDTDADGTPNLVEYFSNDDPSAPSSNPLSLIRETDGSLTLAIRESLDLTGRGLIGEIQESTDLSNWSAVAFLAERSNRVADDTGQRTRTLALLSPSSAEHFYRLRITLTD